MESQTKNIALYQTWCSSFEASLDERSPKTIASYMQHLRIFSRWYEQTNGTPFSIEFMTSYDCRAFRSYSLDVERVKPATWNARRSALLRLAQWGLDIGALTIDPMRGVRTEKQEELAPRWFEEKDINRLMRQTEISVNTANTPLRKEKAIRDAAMISLMLNGGLRVGEMVSLQRQDIVVSERKGRIQIIGGKGEKSRKVPLNSEARRDMRAWLEIHQDELVFPISTRQVEKIIAASGIPGLTPHRLRHTCLKRMVDADRMVEARKIAGHAKFETTAKYTLPSYQDLEEAVEMGMHGKNARRRNYE